MYNPLVDSTTPRPNTYTDNTWPTGALPYITVPGEFVPTRETENIRDSQGNVITESVIRLSWAFDNSDPSGVTFGSLRFQIRQFVNTPRGRERGYTVIERSTLGSDSSRIVVTPRFTGCTFVVGVSASRIYMAHLRPNEAPYFQRQNLPTTLLQSADPTGLFEGATEPMQIMAFGGDANGYGLGGFGRVMGVITQRNIFFVMQRIDGANQVVGAVFNAFPTLP